MLLTKFEQRAAARIPAAAPTPSPLVMPGIAAAAGVPIEVVDGGQAVFGRPDPGQSEVGPITRVLQERVQGSSEEVLAAGRSIGGGGALAQVEADGAANERQPDALAATIGGVDPRAPRSSVLGSTIAGEDA